MADFVLRAAAAASLLSALSIPLAAQAPAFSPIVQAHDIAKAAQGPFAYDPSTGEMVDSAIYQDEEEEDPVGVWKGSINLGATFTNGNTQRRTVSAAANATNRGEQDRITLGFFWNYADNDRDTTTSGRDRQIVQRRTRGAAKYDRFLTDDEKLYAFVGITAEADELADLDLRLIATTGLGYQFIESDEMNFNAEAGVGYYQEDRTLGMDTDYFTARVAYHFDWQFRENMQLIQDVEYIPSLEQSDDIYVRKDTRLKVTLTESMFGLLQWVLDYDNTPAPGLERVDNLFLISVGWNF